MTDTDTLADGATDSTIAIIRKLLAKAEHPTTGEAERDAFAAKAQELMIKYAVDRALVDATNHATDDPIVKLDFYVKVPKSYSYEFATIAIRIAESFGAAGFVSQQQDGVHPTIVGYQSDLQIASALYASIVVQATLSLGSWFKRSVPSYASGSEKWNAKRSFLISYGKGVKDKLDVSRKKIVEDAGPATALALVDRSTAVHGWINHNMNIGRGTSRSYDESGAGFAAGQSANIGQRAAGAGRKAIGA